MQSPAPESVATIFSDDAFPTLAELPPARQKWCSPGIHNHIASAPPVPTFNTAIINRRKKVTRIDTRKKKTTITRSVKTDVVPVAGLANDVRRMGPECHVL